MIALIDNFDSFTFNLYQQVSRLLTNARSQPEQVFVVRNNVMKAEEIIELKPEALIFSPGPGGPDDTGVCKELIEIAIAKKLPLLGVCLGHQLIASYFGAKVSRAPKPVHGQHSLIFHNANGLFVGATNPMQVARYHSLAVYELPDCLSLDAKTEDGVIMALSHIELPIWGVQFHPESFMTVEGDNIISNFLSFVYPEGFYSPLDL